MLKNAVLALIIVILCFACSYRVDSYNEYQHYHSMLVQEAIENIKTLPAPEAEIYRRMLSEYDDVLIAFILAKEESSKLMLADPQDVLTHYEAVRELWERLQGSYSIPFFLSYIGKITVTEERITPYRELFKEHGLYQLPELYPDLEELVREVNLWTRGYMTFRPSSGRDMAPVDIINRTNIGRCEEMMIFFISAARSLGIPARPASTPYWGHMDNNHAWVEVFVNGRWRHLGAVEPAYNLDDAWFSANAAKAIIITATAAFPDTSDIVIGRRGYVSVINSTPNYDSEETKARKIKVVTRNEAGEVMPDCQITLQVFNWGSLRPILQSKTDENGRLDLVTGNGSFFITAFKDSLFALYAVPAAIDGYKAEMTLGKIEHLESLSTKLEYKDRVVDKLPAADDWQQRLDDVVEGYNNIVSSYQDLPFPDDEPDSLLLEVWELCRNNKDNFLTFYYQSNPEVQFYHYLSKLDPKFLWQAEPHQFETVYENYLLINDFDLPEDAMITLLSPTVFFEEVPLGSLPEHLVQWRNRDNPIEEIIAYLKESYEIDNEKAIQTFQMPADILSGLPILTTYQFKILTTAVLNANHIPARYSRMPDIVVVFTDNSWKYYNIEENSFFSDEKVEREKYEVTLRTHDEYGYPVVLNRSQFNLMFLRDGLFYPNQIPMVVDDEGLLSASLEKGSYQLHIGYRPSSNDTYFTLKNIYVDDEAKEYSLTLKGYPRKWEGTDDELDELISALNNELAQIDNLTYILLGDIDREMVKRLSERLVEQAEEGTFVWLGTTTSPDSPPFYQVSQVYHNWLNEYPTYNDRIITLRLESDGKTTFFDGIWDTLPKE